MTKELIKQAINSAQSRKYYLLVHNVENGQAISRQRSAKNHEELMDITVQALQQMIPMKPIFETVDLYGFPEKWEAHCRNCDYSDRGLKDSKGNLYNYCPDCGRPIDWR